MADNTGEPYIAYPLPDAILGMSEEQLRACKLGYRWRYVRAAALAVADGALVLPALIPAEEEETLACLTAVPGVGVKVASCVSLFGLHHMDAFPVDVWIKRILANEYPAGYPISCFLPCKINTADKSHGGPVSPYPAALPLPLNPASGIIIFPQFSVCS